jgi:capsule polysaccharide export protein KpsE/RkpR
MNSPKSEEPTKRVNSLNQSEVKHKANYIWFIIMILLIYFGLYAI